MKKVNIITIIIFLSMAFIFSFRFFLPYGRLDKDSELCKKPELFQNPTKCKLSGCIWGNGDLTGPPFCGAYKK